jgi:ketosteroid isomerase-like protein
MLPTVFARLRDNAIGYVRAHPVRAALICGIVGGVLSSVIADAIVETVRILVSRPESTTEIERLIADEARLAREAPNGVDSYTAMFSEDALVVDVQGNQQFKGRGEIADRFRTLPRFTTLVHDLLEPPAIHDDSAAVATLSTIEFEGQRYAGNEIWMFVRVDGRWKIHRLRFNNPH